MRRDPIYLSTFTGRPPDEPSVLGEALNEVFTPLLIQQFPEIADFWLPPEACSYRVAVVAIRKGYPGHARRIMMAVRSEEHTSELQSLMRISYAVFCLQKKTTKNTDTKKLIQIMKTK